MATASSICSASPRMDKPYRRSTTGPGITTGKIVRPRAAQAFGDQRINPFGVGGGSGSPLRLAGAKAADHGAADFISDWASKPRTDVVRVIWPNGAVRAEFDVKADQEVVTEQRLKGSCPFLFAYNGKQMEFVKDAVPWGSAIGLRINTLGSANIAATEEWYKIGRDQLVPHDGYYDLRITGGIMGGLLLRSSGAHDRRSPGRDRRSSSMSDS